MTSIEKLWEMYKKLTVGVIKDLPGQKVPHGSLLVTIGYGQKIFKLNGVRKSIPRDFKNSQFLEPRKNGGPVIEGSLLSYSKDIHENVGLTEDIMIQFIGDTQLAVNRAIVETWKHINNKQLKNVLIFSKFYTGFQRDDGRSWLGFYDGVSNLRPGNERKNVISITRDNNELLSKDFWTEYGTYLAFMRFEVNLEIWDSLNRIKQELIIGRDKLYGRPIIGIDKDGNSLTFKKTPSAKKIIKYNKKYHDHPNYFKDPQVSMSIKSKIDFNKSFNILNQSHIGRTRHFDGITSKLVPSRRIYRQGFEFIREYNNNSPKPIRVGLNFLSFQNDPARLLFILTDPNWMGNSSFGGDSQFNSKRLLSVHACGIFFVPPIENPFPGSSIFK